MAKTESIIPDDEILFNAVNLDTPFPASILYSDMCFVTGSDELTANILKKHGVKLKDILYSYNFKDDPKYHVHVARYKNSQSTDLENALYDLEKTMVAFGYPDYEETCNKLWAAMDPNFAKNTEV